MVGALFDLQQVFDGGDSLQGKPIRFVLHFRRRMLSSGYTTSYSNLMSIGTHELFESSDEHGLEFPKTDSYSLKVGVIHSENGAPIPAILLSAIAEELGKGVVDEQAGVFDYILKNLEQVRRALSAAGGIDVEEVLVVINHFHTQIRDEYMVAEIGYSGSLTIKKLRDQLEGIRILQIHGSQTLLPDSEVSLYLDKLLRILTVMHLEVGKPGESFEEVLRRAIRNGLGTKEEEEV